MRVCNVGRTLLGGLAAVALLTGAPASRAAEENEGLDLALKIEKALTGVAEKASKSVVVITNMQKPRFRQNREIPPDLRRYFGMPDRPQRRDPRGGGSRPAGMGSGVMIRADGYLVTNYHVIQDHDTLVVKLLDGRVFDSGKGEDEVKVVGVDKGTDLAVLQLGGGTLKDLAHVEFGDSDKIRVGQYAIAVGAPFNLDYSVTIGHISQKGRHGMRMTNFENYIQTDASINPGNSGGPLLNIHGKMIGINQFIMTGGGTSRGNIGLGFAIPSSLVERVSRNLIENGEVIRPFLGIGMQELTDLFKKRYGVEQGVLIENVVEGEAAEQAGVKTGDVVTHVGDKAVDSPHDLLFAVLAYKPGDKVKLRVSRDGEEKTFVVVARQRGGTMARTGSNAAGTVEGIGLRLVPSDDGLVVGAIVPKSPADHAEPELQIGDIVILVNGVKVATPQDVGQALKKTKNEVALFYVDRPETGKYLIGIPIGKAK